MSGVHEEIALKGFAALSEAEQKVFRPWLDELGKSSCYPDVFADKSMSAAMKARIDPDADLLIYPDLPRTDWYERILELTGRQSQFGVVALRDIHLVEHYLRRAVESLRAGDARLATKYCGVYSHVLGDMGEPIHAVSPDIIDMVLPPPADCLAMELHANVEGLSAPVDTAGYSPSLLGVNIPQAVMGGYLGLTAVRDVGAAQAVPIVQALYAKDRQKAVSLSSKAQSESARRFADFLHTVVYLAQRGETAASFSLDLCRYPCVDCFVDMLYRYRPMEDLSLVPYSGGKSYPLALSDGRGVARAVHGLGVVPYLGPPYTADHFRETFIEYFLVPGAFKVFRSRAGLNPHFAESVGAAVFTVAADGREVFRSAEIRPKGKPVKVEVALGDARWLRLAMHYGVNPTREEMSRTSHIGWALHGVWAEPILAC